MSVYVKDVAEADFQQAVLERSKQVPVVVDFWAEWCEPCKALSPLLDRVAQEYEGAFELAKIDVDANQALSGQLGIKSIPTVIAFVDGRPVNQFQGAIPDAQLRSWLASFVVAPTDPAVTAAISLLERGDEAGAEASLKTILQDHFDEDAAITLALLYIDQNRLAESLELLGTLPPSEEVTRLTAVARMGEAAAGADDLTARLEAEPDNLEVRIQLARAVAGRGEYEEALESLLDIVTAKVDESDAAREGMLEIFDVLGNEQPVTQSYRRRLANALF